MFADMTVTEVTVLQLSQPLFCNLHLKFVHLYIHHALIFDLMNELLVQQPLTDEMLYPLTSSEPPFYLHLKRNSRPFFFLNT